MGQLVDGQWVTTQWAETNERPRDNFGDNPGQSGRFHRSSAQFRDWVRADASTSFSPVDGRYHLYVSMACPWAHRAVLVRALMGLESAIGLSIVEPFMDDDGWRFDPKVAGATADNVLGHTYLRDVYRSADPRYTGRVTVPVLWDTHEHTIVNNESREIVRMLDHEFAGLAQRNVDLAPPELRDDVERAIDAMYEPINNGVYKAGFAATQRAYDEAVDELFDALDEHDELLGRQRWLVGDRLTEADLFLFTTLIRFDSVYHTHFKCNRRRIIDYPNLSGFMRELHQVPAIAQTCNLEHIRVHYFTSHPSINPRRIVAVGPELELERPHGRERLGGVGARELLER